MTWGRGVVVTAIGVIDEHAASARAEQATRMRWDGRRTGQDSSLSRGAALARKRPGAEPGCTIWLASGAPLFEAGSWSADRGCERARFRPHRRGAPPRA